MLRIILIKTSSMGDIVHNLPAVGDLRAFLPDRHVDWAVESAFSAIAGLHPGVDQLIPVSIRRRRTQPFAADIRREVASATQRLGELN